MEIRTINVDTKSLPSKLLISINGARPMRRSTFDLMTVARDNLSAVITINNEAVQADLLKAWRQ